MERACQHNCPNVETQPWKNECSFDHMSMWFAFEFNSRSFLTQLSRGRQNMGVETMQQWSRKKIMTNGTCKQQGAAGRKDWQWCSKWTNKQTLLQNSDELGGGQVSQTGKNQKHCCPSQRKLLHGWQTTKKQAEVQGVCIDCTAAQMVHLVKHSQRKSKVAQQWQKNKTLGPSTKSLLSSRGVHNLKNAATARNSSMQVEQWCGGLTRAKWDVGAMSCKTNKTRSLELTPTICHSTNQTCFVVQSGTKRMEMTALINSCPWFEAHDNSCTHHDTKTH